MVTKERIRIVIRLNIPNTDSHIQKIVDDSTYVAQKYVNGG